MVFRRTAFGTVWGTMSERFSRRKYMLESIGPTLVLPTSTRIKKTTAMMRKKELRYAQVCRVFVARRSSEFDGFSEYEA